MRLLWTAIFIVVAGAALPALAGRRTPAPVVVNTATRTASGSQGTARSSSDSQQRIGCSFALIPAAPGSSDPAQRQFSCFAATSTGLFVMCFFPETATNGDFLSVLAEDSFIRFTWDASGTCTSLRVENASYYEPVQP